MLSAAAIDSVLAISLFAELAIILSLPACNGVYLQDDWDYSYCGQWISGRLMASACENGPFLILPRALMVG